MAPPTLLTLPLETKFEIFSHLLLAENVKVPPSKVDQFFKFETAILRVNKQLYGEAFAYLNTRNTFVLITYRSSSTEKEIDRAVIPFVAKDQALKSSRNPSITLTVDWDADNSSHYGTILILLQDLALFCSRVLQWVAHKVHSDRIWIYSPLGVRQLWQRNMTNEIGAKILTEVDKSSHRKLSATDELQRQTRLLAPLANLHHFAKAVHFQNVDAGLAASLTESMSSQIVHLDAAGWGLLEVAQREKARLDDMLGPKEPLWSVWSWRVVPILEDDFVNLNTMFELYDTLKEFLLDSFVLQWYGDLKRYHVIIGPRRLFAGLTDAEITETWQMGLLLLMIDVHLTCSGLALATHDDKLIKRFVIHPFTEAYAPLGELKEFIPHRLDVDIIYHRIMCWYTTSSTPESRRAGLRTALDVLEYSLLHFPEDSDMRWDRELLFKDLTLMSICISNSSQPYVDPYL